MNIVTILIFDAFAFGIFGFVCGWYTRKNDYDGEIVVIHDPTGKLIYSLELDDDPESLQSKKSVSFKIKFLEDSQDRE